ncbi:MAG: 50S ribosomal protein L35 [Deltaproteobacteria bacterium]|nr:50S ribosomal protein L35 [Deltaproteobacteria bacterium]
MPKIKTNRGAAKRFKLTARGKIKHKKRGHSHILTKKTTQRKRRLRQAAQVSGADKRSVRRLMPYG